MHDGEEHGGAERADSTTAPPEGQPRRRQLAVGPFEAELDLVGACGQAIQRLRHGRPLRLVQTLQQGNRDLYGRLGEQRDDKEKLRGDDGMRRLRIP